MNDELFISELDREMSQARREADSYHSALISLMLVSMFICFYCAICGG